jgi:hypothetical protein
MEGGGSSQPAGGWPDGVKRHGAGPLGGVWRRDGGRGLRSSRSRIFWADLVLTEGESNLGRGVPCVGAPRDGP